MYLTRQLNHNSQKIVYGCEVLAYRMQTWLWEKLKSQNLLHWWHHGVWISNT